MTKAIQDQSLTYSEWSDGKKRSWEEPEEPEPGTAPAWAPTMSLDVWTPLDVVNTFADVQAANVGQYATSGPDSVLTAWNGAALIPEFGDSGSVLHWGGGHADYHGNEVYSFDLATLTWSRLTEPSTSGAEPFTNGIRGDGTPNVPHTYHFLAARNGTLVTALREVDSDPLVWTNQVSIFDPVTETWTNHTGTPTGISAGGNEGCVYDSSRDGLWLIENDPLSWAFWDFSASEWTSYDDNFHAYAPRGQVYVPGHDCVVLFTSAGPRGLDPANPEDVGTNDVALTTSGTAPSSATGDCQRWSANLGAIVYYRSQSNDIYLLTPPEGDWTTGTWVWSQRTLTGTSGTHDGSNGTWGKFNVAEWGAITVALVCGDVDGAYRAVRLA